MKNEQSNCKIFAIFAFIIIFCLLAFTIAVLFTSQIVNIEWILLSFLFQLIFCIFLINTFIPDSVNEKSINQKGAAFVTNLIFLISTTMFITINTFYFSWWFQTISFISSFILLLFINYRISKENEINLTSLKISNYFIITFLSGMMVLLKNHNDNVKIQELMHYYYLTPLLLLQGLYHLLGKRIKNK